MKWRLMPYEMFISSWQLTISLPRRRSCERAFRASFAWGARSGRGRGVPVHFFADQTLPLRLGRVGSEHGALGAGAARLVLCPRLRALCAGFIAHGGSGVLIR